MQISPSAVACRAQTQHNARFLPDCVALSRLIIAAFAARNCDAIRETSGWNFRNAVDYSAKNGLYTSVCVPRNRALRSPFVNAIRQRNSSRSSGYEKNGKLRDVCSVCEMCNNIAKEMLREFMSALGKISELLSMCVFWCWNFER